MVDLFSSSLHCPKYHYTWNCWKYAKLMVLTSGEDDRQFTTTNWPKRPVWSTEMLICYVKKLFRKMFLFGLLWCDCFLWQTSTLSSLHWCSRSQGIHRSGVSFSVGIVCNDKVTESKSRALTCIISHGEETNNWGSLHGFFVGFFSENKKAFGSFFV